MNTVIPYLAVLVVGHTVMPTVAAAQPDVRTRIAGRVVTREMIRNGKAGDFQPAVAATDSGGLCYRRPPSGPDRERTLVLRFGANADQSRSVAVTLDSSGVPMRYSDLRGDLRAPFDRSVTAEKPIGVRTSIAIDLRDTTAMLHNAGGGRDSTVLRVKGAPVLTADNLGVPSQLIAKILAECGAPPAP